MSIELLDRAKSITGSDTETGRRIGMRQSHVADVRAGVRTLTPFQAAQIAELTGATWYESAFPALASKAKTAKERRYWLGKLETLKRTAAMVCLGVFLAIIPQHGGNGGASPISVERLPVCILCKMSDYILSGYFLLKCFLFCAKKAPSGAFILPAGQQRHYDVVRGDWTLKVGPC